jgi:hypothetical protein
MEKLWVVLSAVTLGILFLGFVYVARGLRRLDDLSRRPAPDRPTFPSLTIIVAARNEERRIEEALESLFRLDYPDVEVVVVDDRSTDGTPAILERLGTLHPKLRVMRVDRLPKGWLGKCHALWLGAQSASGEYFLFTDADVVFRPPALRQAMTYVLEKGLDHLALLLHVRMPGPVLPAMSATFGLFFMLYSRPWKAPDPKSPAHIGIGAFNLVRKAAYQAAGGHEAVRMCPVDDVKLGERVKASGGKQAAAIGVELAWVEWYRTVGELVRGLEKNCFAGVDYRVSAVVLSTVAVLALSVGPVALLWLLPNWLGLSLNGASLLLLLALYLDQVRLQKVPLGSAFFFPFSLGLMIFIMWRSALMTLIRGGISWRDTFYPLDELRKPSS